MRDTCANVLAVLRAVFREIRFVHARRGALLDHADGADELVVPPGHVVDGDAVRAKHLGGRIERRGSPARPSYPSAPPRSRHARRTTTLGTALPASTSYVRRTVSRSRANGPTVSRPSASGKMPSSESAPVAGRTPEMPLSAAGMRMEPSVSLPSAMSASPAATAAAEPPLEPPTVRVEVPRVGGAPEVRVLRGDAPRELVRVRLADHERAGGAQRGDDGRVVLGIAAEERGARARGQPGDVDDVFHRERPAVQRAARGGLDRVEPRRVAQHRGVVDGDVTAQLGVHRGDSRQQRARAFGDDPVAHGERLRDGRRDASQDSLRRTAVSKTSARVRHCATARARSASFARCTNVWAVPTGMPSRRAMSR